MPDQQIHDRLNEIGDRLRREPSVHDEVMRRVTQAAATGAPRPSRILSRRAIVQLAALAACVLIVALIWNARGGLGAQEAFAAAIQNVARARTFSCIQIHTFIEDGEEQMHETAVMFKEPDRDRTEYRRFHEGWAHDAVITDYALRRRLLLNKDKTATMQDISSLYEVDLETGELELSDLSTRVRDDVLKISARAVKDMGMTNLDGQQVRVLRSQDADEPIETVYLNPKTNAPAQIELAWPSRQSSYTYASIQIDTALDDALFSLDVPPGYAPPEEERRQVSDHHAKMAAKMMHLMRAAYQHLSKHDAFPAEPADLVPGVLDEKALKTLLAAPDQPDGPPVIVYRQPRPDRDPGTDIVAYEAAEHRRDGKVVVGMADGRAEVLTAERFEELMK